MLIALILQLRRASKCGKLTSLEESWVDGCVKLKNIGGTYLRTFGVRGLSEFEEMPSIGTLVSLEELRVGGCAKFKRIGGYHSRQSFQIQVYVHSLNQRRKVLNIVCHWRC